MTATTSISATGRTGTPTTALTLQVVESAVALIREVPKTGIYSCCLFPGTQTTSFKADDGEVFHIAAPGFWAAIFEQIEPDTLGLPVSSMCGVPLVNLDLNLEERARVMTALLKALGGFADAGAAGEA